jgi:hypothetical protein
MFVHSATLCTKASIDNDEIDTITPASLLHPLQPVDIRHVHFPGIIFPRLIPAKRRKYNWRSAFFPMFATK